MPKRLVEVDVADAPATEDVQGAEETQKVLPKKKRPRRAQIRINEQDNHEAPEVFVSVNGRAYKMQRNKDIWVPWEVYHVLMNAIETRYFKDENTGEILPKDVPRFPVVLIKEEF